MRMEGLLQIVEAYFNPLRAPRVQNPLQANGRRKVYAPRRDKPKIFSSYARPMNILRPGQKPKVPVQSFPTTGG